MPRLIYFAHDALDPAVRRRIRAFAEAGAQITGFTMRRGPHEAVTWDNVDLGRTYDANFSQRLVMMFRAVPTVAWHRDRLRDADIYYARNLDMLVLARIAKWLAGARAKIVYECLDIHRFLTRTNLIGAGARGVERSLLAKTDLVVASSPAFFQEYFDVQHRDRYRGRLIENRLPRGYDYGPRPASARGPVPGHPIRIGWFGNLRCRRSLALLLETAKRFPDRVHVVLRGAPARTEIPDLESQIEGFANVTFAGRYSWPEDLSFIYGGVDLVWAGDFHDRGANSAWLLPNRLYEGGYFGVPPVAPAASETGRWIESRGFGFTVGEPLENTLPEFLGALDRDAIGRVRERLIAAPEDVFLQSPNEIKDLLTAVLDGS